MSKASFSFFSKENTHMLFSCIFDSDKGEGFSSDSYSQRLHRLEPIYIIDLRSVPFTRGLDLKLSLPALRLSTRDPSPQHRVIQVYVLW